MMILIVATFLGNVGENVLSSATFAFVLLVGGYLYLKIGARRTFRFQSAEPPTVVTTALTPVATGRYRRAATGIGPVRALSELAPRYALAYWRRRLDHIFTSDAQLHERRSGDLILLGGEKLNEVTRDALNLLAEDSGTFPVVTTSESDIKWAGTSYASEGDGERLTADYGLVVRARNPWTSGTEATVVILTGASTHGNHAAARIFVADRWFRKSGEVAALVHCKVRDDLPVAVRVVARARRRPGSVAWELMA